MKYENDEERITARKIYKKNYNKKYYLNNKYKLKYIKKEYYLKNKTKIKYKNKKYYLQNKNKLKDNTNNLYLKNRKNILNVKKLYYLDNKDKIKERINKYYLNNIEIMRKKQNIRKTNLRIQAMNVLGEVICKFCGCVDIRCLQIDHINNNGKIERETFGIYKIYKKIINNPKQAILEYQILCANCNIIKEQIKINNTLHNLTKIQIYTRYKYKKLRTQTMLLLGGVFCKECGKIDIRYLQIDHIKGGGGKEIFKLKRWFIYKKIRDDPTCRNNYQVLCANCNRIKTIVNDETTRKHKR